MIRQCSRRRLLRKALEFHVCTINKSAYMKKKKSGNLSNDPRMWNISFFFHLFSDCFYEEFWHATYLQRKYAHLENILTNKSSEENEFLPWQIEVISLLPHNSSSLRFAITSWNMFELNSWWNNLYFLRLLTYLQPLVLSTIVQWALKQFAFFFFIDIHYFLFLWTFINVLVFKYFKTKTEKQNERKVFHPD